MDMTMTQGMREGSSFGITSPSAHFHPLKFQKIIHFFFVSIKQQLMGFMDFYSFLIFMKFSYCLK